MNQLLRVDHLSMRYQSAEGEIDAIDDVSFSVSDGEFVSVIGPSGCGKSTMLSLIAGLMKPSGGEIKIETQKAPKDALGYMLQKDCLFEWRTIRQNVTLGLEIRGIMSKENLEYADQLLSTYGLYDFRDSYPDRLSGGMRQRCALIRTLVARPEILLLYEPFSALDYQTRLSVSDDIYTIIRREKKTAVMVTHDISEAVSMSDRVIVLTKRPATVKSEHVITFAGGRISPIACREHEEFKDYFNHIWRDIDVHV